MFVSLFKIGVFQNSRRGAVTVGTHAIVGLLLKIQILVAKKRATTTVAVGGAQAHLWPQAKKRREQGARVPCPLCLTIAVVEAVVLVVAVVAARVPSLSASHSY